MHDLKSYLQTRRSSLSMSLEEPGPDQAQLRAILEIAARVPDHGKLAPWRFVLWPRNVRTTMHRNLLALLEGMEDVPDIGKLTQGTDKLLHAPVVVAVISRAAEHPKIPLWEQHLSAGAVCMSLLMAANAHGFEAQWLTAWYVYSDATRDILQLEEGERIAGIIHIGTSSTPKSERSRPELQDIFSIRES